MKKIITLFLLCFTITGLYSQQFNNFFSDTIPRLNFSVQGISDYGSSFANNQFLNKFIYGGKIEKSDKTNLYNKLSAKNTIGGDVNFKVQSEIPFDTLFGKTNLSVVVGVEHTEHFDAKLSDDIVKLILDGNKQFAGSHAELGSTNFNYFNYQQINFGIVNYKKTKEKSIREGVIFSFIKAQEHQAITIPEGTLFTEQIGKELIFDLNYIYNGSDTTNYGFKAYNGFGISTDLFTEFKISNGDKILLNIDDLGFIQWNKKSIQIEADSIVSFDGVEIDNIFNINDSLISSFSRDSLLEYVSNKKGQGGYAIALPTTFHVSYMHAFTSKWKMNVGFRYKILANYMPQLYANVQFLLGNNLVAQGNIVYGGYGKFNMGVIVAKQFKEKYQIIIGSEHLGAYLLPSVTYSNNGILGLKMYF